MRLAAILILTSLMNVGNADAQSTTTTVTTCTGPDCSRNGQGQGSNQRYSNGPVQANNCFDRGVAECAAADQASADACAPPSNIVNMINVVAPLLQAGDPKTACAKIAALYAMAGSLEGVWAAKCLRAATSCVNSCGRIKTYIKNHLQTCQSNTEPHYEWALQVQACDNGIRDPVCQGLPRNYSQMSLNPRCDGTVKVLRCSCEIPNSPALNECRRKEAAESQLLDANSRHGLCSGDRGKSLAAIMEASVMGMAAFYNSKCAVEAAGGGNTGGSGGNVGTTGEPPPGEQCFSLSADGTAIGWTKPACPNFCDGPGNLEKPECSCDLPQWYAHPRCNCKHTGDDQNQLCQRPTGPPGGPTLPPQVPQPNPYNPQTPPVTGGRITPPPGPTPGRQTPSIEEDIDGGIDQEYNPVGGGPGGPGQKVGEIPGGGGGGGIAPFGGGGGGSGGGAGGPGQGPYNTDITSGYGNSGGGGAGAGGGGGGYPGAGAAGGGYGLPEGADKDKIDLSQFLPKVDKARGLAGVDPELAANGITAANGLSNWEKVTRKMNEKRPTLLP